MSMRPEGDTPSRSEGLRATPVERAFELARSGDCETIQDIRLKLRAEGLSDSQVTGPSLLRQLRGLIAGAKVSEPADEGAAE